MASLVKHCTGSCDNFVNVCCFDCPEYDNCVLDDRCDKEEVLFENAEHYNCTGHNNLIKE